MTGTLISNSLLENLTTKIIEERSIPLDEIKELQYEPDSSRQGLDHALYQSIKEVGLQSPLVVARESNQQHFVPIAGGNSRLRALRYLYHETDNDSFSKIDCVVSEWPGVLQARLAHITTNEIRTCYSFASRSRAIVHIIEAEGSKKNAKQTSQREAVELLTSNGYPISQATYGYMKYVVNRLLPNICTELLHSIKISDARELREIESHARKLWQSRKKPSRDFDALLSNVLTRASSNCFVVDELIQEVRQLLDHLEIANHRQEEVRTTIPNLTSNSGQARLQVNSSDLVDKEVATSKQIESTGNKSTERCSESIKKKENQHDESHFSTTPEPTPKDISTASIVKLRATAGRLASRLCSNLDMNKCLIKESKPYGFQMVDNPPVDFSPIQYQVWCYLKVFAGIQRSEPKSSNGTVDQTTEGRAASEYDSIEVSTNSTNYSHLDATLWVQLDDENWKSMIELWDVVRKIRKCGRVNTNETNLSLEAV